MNRPNFCLNKAETVIVALRANDSAIPKIGDTMPICFEHAYKLGKEIGKGIYQDFDLAESFDFDGECYCYWELDFPACQP
jgi:hypothetical protein